MKNELYLSGEVGYEITLKGVTDAFKDNPNITDVFINSIGGYVTEGIAIYNFLKEKNVNTHGIGIVASIGTIIFLAGKKDTREVYETDDFLIHYPMGIGAGTADDVQKVADELKLKQNKLAKIYALETNLTKDEALAQMEKDEMMSPDWLLEKGFISKIKKFKAVAKLNINQEKMNLNKDDKNWLDSQFEKIGKLFQAKHPQQTNKIVQDANGDDIDFYELESDATIEVGAKARNESGEDINENVLMPSGETYVFENGELKEIQPKADDAEELKNEIEDLKTKLAEAKSENDNVVAKLDEVKEQFEMFKDELKTKFEYGKKEPKKNNVQRINLRK